MFFWDLHPVYLQKQKSITILETLRNSIHCTFWFPAQELGILPPDDRPHSRVKLLDPRWTHSNQTYVIWGYLESNPELISLQCSQAFVKAVRTHTSRWLKPWLLYRINKMGPNLVCYKCQKIISSHIIGRSWRDILVIDTDHTDRET